MKKVLLTSVIVGMLGTILALLCFGNNWDGGVGIQFWFILISGFFDSVFESIMSHEAAFLVSSFFVWFTVGFAVFFLRWIIYRRKAESKS